MEFLEGEIQRQLSVNAVALTDKVKRFNYGATISALLYIMIYIMTNTMVFIDCHREEVLIASISFTRLC